MPLLNGPPLILSMTDESSGEFSPSDSDSEYNPVKSNRSVTESEEEMVPPKRIRCSQDQATKSSATHLTGELANTNGARPRDERPSTSTGVSHQSPRIRAFVSLPDALAN